MLFCLLEPPTEDSLRIKDTSPQVSFIQRLHCSLILRRNRKGDLHDIVMHVYKSLLFVGKWLINVPLSIYVFFSLLHAQVYRLQNQVDLAVSDLNMAIQLSEGHGKVAERAHCQRGLIRRLQGLDEEALEDFKAAARLGSRFAQRQVVAMNPYAALCNQMLSEAFGKLRRGETQ